MFIMSSLTLFQLYQFPTLEHQTECTLAFFNHDRTISQVMGAKYSNNSTAKKKKKKLN